LDLQFGGIVYLHDLAQTRQGPSGKKAMTPTKLSHPEIVRRVVLATVKGDGVTQLQAERRENKLKDNTWQKAVEGGAQMCRFMDTKDSAWGIVDMILERGTIELSCIQKELEEICTMLPTRLSSMRKVLNFFSLLFSPKLGRKVSSCCLSFFLLICSQQ
jgi:hypothetical protein